MLICDFSGFRAPEMVKSRPVVVFHRHPTNGQLVTIVPLSTSKPSPVLPYHYEFRYNPMPHAMPWEIAWAKCDMVATVPTDRLSRFRLKANGREEFVEPRISDDEFRSIQECVALGLGLSAVEGRGVGK